MQVSSKHYLYTPSLIKNLIIATVLISFFSPISSFFMGYFFQHPGPQVWLPLSLYGLKHQMLWQFVSYIFVNTAQMHITFSFLVSLLVLMLLLWFTGKEIHYRFGWKGFVLLYLSCGIFAGLVTGGVLYLTKSHEHIATSASSVFGLMIVFAMMFSDLRIHALFWSISVRVLIFIFLSLSLFLHLVRGEFMYMLNEAMGIMWGYLFGRYIWGLPTLIKLRRYTPAKDKVIDIDEL